MYAVSGKKVYGILGITLSNTIGFSQFFHLHSVLEICNKAINPSHLKRVATLPCEELMSENYRSVSQNFTRNVDLF